MTILVTGATGHLGGLIVDKLLARGIEPKAIVAGGRNPQRLADIAASGILTMPLDYEEPHTLVSALAGIETVMLVSGSEVGKRIAQHGSVIEAAKAAGVARIVYTSAPQADTSPIILAPEHKATEELIHASQIPFTILRNNWYNENYVPVVERARRSGVLLSATAQGRVASAARGDLAEAAAVVLTSEGHEGKSYELSGDVAWTSAELAEDAAEVLGMPIELRELSPDDYRHALIEGGTPEHAAAFAAQLDDDIRQGWLGETTGELRRLIGRPTTPIRETLRLAFTPPPPGGPAVA